MRVIFALPIVLWLTPLLYVLLLSLFHPIENGLPSPGAQLSIDNYALLFSRHSGAFALRQSLFVAIGAAATSLFLLYMVSASYFLARLPLIPFLIPLFAMKSIPPIMFLIFFVATENLLLFQIDVFVLPVIQALTFLPLLLLVYVPFLDRTCHPSKGRQSLLGIAALDNLTPYCQFRYVVFPNTLGIFMVCGLVSFAMSWSELLFAGQFAFEREARTLPVLFGSLETSQRLFWGPLFSGIALSTIVIIAISGLALYAVGTTLKRTVR